MPIRNKPTRFSKDWVTPHQLFEETMREIDELISVARDTGDPLYFRCAVRSMIVYLEAFYSTALHRVDCLLELYYDIEQVDPELSKEYRDICNASFNSSLSESESSFLYESRFDALNPTRFKKTIKLLEKFYRSDVKYDFSGGEWRDIVSIFELRHCYTHPKNHGDLEVTQVARRMNGGGLKTIEYLQHLYKLAGNCFDSMKEVLAATAEPNLDG